MKKLVAALAMTGLIAGMVPGAIAGPSAGGISSDNVEHVTFVPFEVGTATGAMLFDHDKYLVVTSWKTFSIYDVSEPTNPVRLSTVPFGFKFENENVATNGKIMLFSEELPGDTLHIYDIEDKSNPVPLATVPNAGDHTTSCILNCKWSYGSDGTIVNLSDPAKPVLAKETWGEGTPAGNNGHDITEVAPGLVLTSTNPMMFLDARKDPLHPKVLAVSETMTGFVHSNQWPRGAKDRWALSTGETWVGGVDSVCDDNSAGLSTHDTTNWKKNHSFKLVDTFRMKNGVEGGGPTNGNPAMNGPFGCSSHWFETHPDWNNGGLVAGGFYNHGTRFLEVSSKGKISEIGWFLPTGGGTSAAYWVNDEIVYAIDYQRGFDVLRFSGK